MRQVTVRSVCVGGIVDDNGRFLKVIGNMPIQAGDTVWTDGRIVYGHRPVRPTVKTTDALIGYPYAGKTECGAVSESGNDIRKAKNIEPFKSHASNWMYIDDKGELYTYMTGTKNPIEQKIDDQDSSFYLDMLVTDDAVYTAEIMLDQLALFGKTPAFSSWGIGLDAGNFYFPETGYAGEKPTFGFSWLPTADGKVAGNTGIRLRKNGAQIGIITLDKYQIALDIYKQLYAAYDVYDKDIKKRYTKDPTLEGTKIQNAAIWVSLWTVQILNFRFTSENGDWEMILCTTSQGSFAPHSIDQEYDEEKEEWETVHSVYSVSVPIVYYVLKVDSAGNQTVLQQWIRVKKFSNNLVNNKYWTHAKNAYVEEIYIDQRPPITLQYQDGAIETDLMHIIGVYNKNGMCLLNNLKLNTIDMMIVPDPNVDVDRYGYGASNQMQITDAASGAVSVATWYYQELPFAPYLQSNSYGVVIDYDVQRASFGGDGAGYIGRLSINKLDDGGYLIAMHGHAFFVVAKDGSIKSVGDYCYNMGVGKIRRKNKLKRPKTIRDLIASKTKGNDDES